MITHKLTAIEEKMCQHLALEERSVRMKLLLKWVEMIRSAQKSAPEVFEKFRQLVEGKEYNPTTQLPYAMDDRFTTTQLEMQARYMALICRLQSLTGIRI